MLTLGVTGHRDIQKPYRVILSALNAAIMQLGSVTKIDEICLLSALAEGADTFAVEYMLRRFHCKLMVPLPMTTEEYEADFSTAAAVRRFRWLLGQANQVITLSRDGTRPQVYELVGEYLVGHSDLLLAFWDGLPEHGRGGTAAVVFSARKKGIPICWILAARRGQRLIQRPAFSFENLEKLTR
jgi:hypothetical protein